MLAQKLSPSKVMLALSASGSSAYDIDSDTDIDSIPTRDRPGRKVEYIPHQVA